MKISRQFLIILFVFFTTIFSVACGDKKAEEPTGPQTKNVAVFNNKFDPAEIKLKVGDQLTWKNKDQIEYVLELNSQSDSFKQVIKPGETFTYTFNNKGKYTITDNSQKPPITMTVIIEE